MRVSTHNSLLNALPRPVVLRRYQAHHGVRITEAAFVAAAQLSDRYLPDRHLPDKAIDLIDEAAAKVSSTAPFYSHCGLFLHFRVSSASPAAFEDALFAS